MKLITSFTQFETFSKFERNFCPLRFELERVNYKPQMMELAPEALILQILQFAETVDRQQR